MLAAIICLQVEKTQVIDELRALLSEPEKQQFLQTWQVGGVAGGRMPATGAAAIQQWVHVAGTYFGHLLMCDQAVSAAHIVPDKNFV